MLRLFRTFKDIGRANRSLSTYNAHRGSLPFLEKQLEDTKTAADITDILNDPNLDDPTALMLVGRKLDAFKMDVALDPEAHLDLSALEQEFRQLSALSSISWRYEELGKAGLVYHAPHDMAMWRRHWSSQTSISLKQLREHAGFWLMGHRIGALKTIMIKIAHGNIPFLKDLPFKFRNAMELLRLPGVHAHSTVITRAGDLPKFSTLQRLALERAQGQFTKEHRQLDRFLTEDQQLFLRYIDSLEQSISAEDITKFIKRIAEGLAKVDSQFVVDDKMFYGYQAKAISLRVHHPKYEESPIVEDMKELQKELSKILDIEQQPMSISKKGMTLIGRIPGETAWRIINIQISLRKTAPQPTADRKRIDVVGHGLSF